MFFKSFNAVCQHRQGWPLKPHACIVKQFQCKLYLLTFLYCFVNVINDLYKCITSTICSEQRGFEVAPLVSVLNLRRGSTWKSYFSWVLCFWCNISKTSASVSSGFPNTRKLMKARGRRPSAFIVFECLETPIKHEPRVFEIASQTCIMNQEQWKNVWLIWEHNAE